MVKHVYRTLLLWLFCWMQAGMLQADDTIRLLCIGNSFSWDAVEQELVPLCNAAGQPIVVGNLYYGGCSLAQHHAFLQQDTAAYEFRYLTNDTTIRLKTYALRQALTGYHWDYVSLQQASHDSGITATYEPFLSALIDSVRHYQPQAILCWMQTWSYSSDAKHPAFPRYQNSQRVMDDSIQLATRYVLQRHPDLHLVPCGAAIRLARRRLGDTLCRDGYHLNYTYGRYLASCVWLEFLRKEEKQTDSAYHLQDIRRNPYRHPAFLCKEEKQSDSAHHLQDIRRNPYRHPAMTRRQQRITQAAAHRVMYYPPALL